MVHRRHTNIAFITKRSVLNNVADTKQWQDTGFAKFRLAFEHAGVQQPIFRAEDGPENLRP